MVAVAMLAVLLPVSGCGVFGGTLYVDPGVVDDMQNAGKALSHTRIKVIMEGRVAFDEIVILDMESPNSAAALSKASKNLQREGWKVIYQKLPEVVDLESARWEGTRLSLYSIDFVETSGKLEPQEKQIIQRARDKTDSGAIIFAQATRTHQL